MNTSKIDLSSPRIEKAPASKPTPSKVAPFKKILPVCDRQEEPEKDTPFALMEGNVPLLVQHSVPVGEEAPLPPVTSVNTELFALFESMAGTMMVMNLTHETRTTLILNQASFISSPFFGTEITITEFTSAPKTFNIEIVSNPSAILAIQKGEEQLLSLFTKGNFGFSIHRLETKIQCDPVSVFEKQDEGENAPRDEDEEQ